MVEGSLSETVLVIAANMEETEKDPRFAHVSKDPRFKTNFKQKKVKIDSRFKSVLDKEFSVQFLDKRGRPVNSSTKEDLRRLYDYEYESDQLQETEEESPEDKEEQRKESSSGEEAGAESNDDHDDFPDLTQEGGPDYARGVGILESSDDEEGGEEDEGEEEEEEQGILDHEWNEVDHNAPEAEEITSRLALCNMDWDRIKAKDLYALFNSFVPQGGAVQSVNIYPSEFGREQMAEEEKLGPRKFQEGEDKAGHMGKLDRAKLRRYQLQRLNYYYAVIVCDSKETAHKLYEECDSMEYEKSSCRIDLRFIPERETFEETPKDSCTGMSDLETFQPSIFTTTAFCQAKVQLTWDEPDIDRVKVMNTTMQKKLTEEDIDAINFDDFVGSPSSESTEGETTSTKKKKKKKTQKNLEKYRKLLGLDDDKPQKKKKSDSAASIGESEAEEEEEAFFSPLAGRENEQELEEEMQFQSSEHSEDEEDGNDTTHTKTKQKEKKKKKKAKKESTDTSEDKEEGEMQYTWQPGSSHQMMKIRAKKKMTPWEEYQQKKKDKKKQKKLNRKLQKLKEQGIEDTTDLGFDDEFFNDEPIDDQKKKKKDRRKKKRQHMEVEETEADEKEKASLALLMKNNDDNRNHFSLMQIMKEESEGKKKKGKKRKQSEIAEPVDTFEMKLDQSRFGSLYTDPDLHIDPNAPEFKKTKGMMAVMEQVSKKRKAIHNAQ